MSTRRNFLRTLATAAFGFTVLPPAKTYERIWKATVVPKINPAWEITSTFIFNPSDYTGTWTWEPGLMPPMRFELKDGIFQQVNQHVLTG